jgi:hypothetical protein
MTFVRRLCRDENGVAIVEMAFALPIMIVMIWMFVQLAQMYRAVAGIQQALGEGARYATLCLDPDPFGCKRPTIANIKAKIQDSVYGIGPGTFTVPDPTPGVQGTATYYDLSVSYTQPTSLLLFPGPTINLSRSKRVWTAGAGS